MGCINSTSDKIDNEDIINKDILLKIDLVLNKNGGYHKMFRLKNINNVSQELAIIETLRLKYVDNYKCTFDTIPAGNSMFININIEPYY